MTSPLKSLGPFPRIAACLFFLGICRAEVAAPLAPLLQPFVEKHELAGAVALVVDRDHVRSIETVGFADIATQKPMRSDSLFWIASETKSITAVAVLMLADEGRIHLDDAVEKYLPEFHGQQVIAEQDATHTILRRPAHPITIREVLSHMSGLPFKSTVEEPHRDALPLAYSVRSYASTPLQTEPGTHYLYSNAGINTAGRIIEVVTGQRYEQFLQQRLFTPLGMKDTTFWPTPEQEKRLATSYRPNSAKNDLEALPIPPLSRPFSDHDHRFPMPGGGLFSTAADVARFCQMLLNGGLLEGKRYLSESSLREMSTRQTPASVTENYGLGFRLNTNGFGHDGAHGTSFEIRPRQGIALVWMVQHAGFPGQGAGAQAIFKTWAATHFGIGQ
jgi:CubicO group peptidase (beta-lactamase class C family)